MALNVILLGPPGAGKGTQAERFAREHGIPKISTGDILREAVQSGTEIGRAAKAVMEAGRLVSDDQMIEIVRERLNRPDARRGFVLDGFPRTVVQAEALDRLLARSAPPIVVDIGVPTEALVRRLASRRICGQCGAITQAATEGDTACGRCGGPLVQRSDDSEKVVRERLAVYERDTKPLVDYYRARPTFRTVDGNQTPDRVAADLRGAVEQVAGNLARAQSETWDSRRDRV